MKKNSIFPAILVACSVLEILQSGLGTLNWLALINSTIGIVGATFFFTKNENYRKLINTWIYLQAVVITKTVIGIEEFTSIEKYSNEITEQYFPKSIQYF